MPWVEHQFLKQTARKLAKLIIVDSSERPWVSEHPSIGVIHAPGVSGISQKRTMALAAADTDLITWFDDDDWQAPTKLEKLPPRDMAAIGARHAYMYSVESGKAGLYESNYEPIIFNSGVYHKSSVPKQFDPGKITGEDTEWHERWLATRPSYVTLGEPMHAWLCHSKNITNTSSSRFFELANPIPFDDWELEFLERMRAGKK